jgi:hypothetical protein
MSSAIATAARSAQARPASNQISGVHSGRISSVRSGLPYVLLPFYDGEREFGPCIVAIGVQGVGPATTDLATGVVTLTNATELVKGMRVLVTFPRVGQPWITSIAPSGAGT